MVALRDTHEASFDFEAWADKLNLPAEQKEKLQECHTYVVSCMHKQAEKQAAEAKKVEEGEAKADKGAEKSAEKSSEKGLGLARAKLLDEKSMIWKPFASYKISTRVRALKPRSTASVACSYRWSMMCVPWSLSWPSVLP